MTEDINILTFDSFIQKIKTIKTYRSNANKVIVKSYASELANQYASQLNFRQALNNYLVGLKDTKEMLSEYEKNLVMERGQSKAVTGKEHLERNDFIMYSFI